MKICIIDNCKRKHLALGWCQPHYERYKRTGSPEGLHSYTPPHSDLSCTANGCNRKHYAKNLCQFHYGRLKKGLDINDPIKGSEHLMEHSLYNTYNSMITRCKYSGHESFPDYGGRGVKVCDEWIGKGGFLRFAKYMGEKPSPKHTLDRIDNDGNYEPGNCRWATQSQQAYNSRIRSTNTSGHTGVCRDKNSWRAYIINNGKHINLGCFKRLPDAVKARKEAEAKYVQV